MRVLVLGGYGTFGGRLLRLLANEPGLTLICAGRSVQKASQFVEALKTQAVLVPARVDRNGDLGAAFSELTPDLIVDATGPFQIYGDAPYRVVEAAIAAGIDYVDLADGADFVDGIEQFDEAAKARDVLVLSGASTFPALSSAVIRHLTEGWQRVESVEHGLAPSPKAGLGRNVIEAIMSYAGKPVPVMRTGEVVTAPALIESRRYVIAPPGVEPMPRLRFSLTELPDQTVLPKRLPHLQNLWGGVGTRPQILLRGLNWCARLVQVGVLKSLSPLAGMAFWSMKQVPFGAHRGGLILRVGGVDGSGQAASREWHMIAEGDDGPFIPSIAVAALVRRRLAGEAFASGARPATDDFELADYEAVFATKEIVSGVRDAPRVGASLFERVLSSAWLQVPELIRAMHTDTDRRVVKGRARVDRGSNPLARLIGAVVGFPPAGDDVPVEVRFSHQDGGELWERSFDGKPFSSFQEEGSGAFEHVLVERFGPLAFGLALIVADEKLWLKTTGWRALGIPMPRFFGPTIKAYEEVVDGRFHFHVEISHWLTGLIVRYRGWLA